jgi:hypothetical protein
VTADPSRLRETGRDDDVNQGSTDAEVFETLDELGA